MDRMISDGEVLEIGCRLRELRKGLGFTQQEFADKLYWDVSSYQKIESGKVLMTLDKAVQIHRDYEVDLNYFVAGDTYDDEDLFRKVVSGSSRKKNVRMMIRLLEYFIRLLQAGLEEEDKISPGDHDPL